MSYEFYKILHLNMLFLTICSLGAAFASEKFSGYKVGKILTHIMTFLVFVAGMGLIARIGIKHGDGFPAWIIVKIVAWFIFTGCAVMVFKFKDQKKKMWSLVIALICVLVASSSAITKLM